MVKKNKFYDYDDEDIVIDKKTKRRLERAKNRENRQQQAEVEAAEPVVVEEEDNGSNVMSEIAVLCQENRWREAVLAGRKALNEAESEGKEDLILPLSMAMEKLEMSLRRQMAAAFLSKSREMLKKEYLLDVGE